MDKIPTAEEYIFDYSQNDVIDNLDKDSKEIITLKMIEFAKLHIIKVKHLQQTKYSSGETGYIKSEEWEEIINQIT